MSTHHFRFECLGARGKDRNFEMNLGKELPDQASSLSPDSRAMVSQGSGTVNTTPKPAIMLQKDSRLFKILSLPLDIQKEVFRHLLVSPEPLLLCRDPSTPDTYRTQIEPEILQASKHCYQIGKPILYGENTLTASSPATSYNFDRHIFAIPGKNRKLITSVTLYIDWADKLWAKFPLVARALEELPPKKLVIIMVRKEENGEKGKERAAPREGAAAGVILNAERKVLKELVKGMATLKVFRLEGFVDKGFVEMLEGLVAGGKP